MWNYVSSWKNQNVQEVFFYVSGVLDSERFFKKISALKNSLFSSRKLRKPDSGTSKKKKEQCGKWCFARLLSLNDLLVKLCRFQTLKKRKKFEFVLENPVSLQEVFMPCLFADLQRHKHRKNSRDHHKQSDFTVGRLEPATLVRAQQETFMVQDH